MSPLTQGLNYRSACDRPRDEILIIRPDDHVFHLPLRQRILAVDAHTIGRAIPA